MIVVFLDSRLLIRTFNASFIILGSSVAVATPALTPRLPSFLPTLPVFETIFPVPETKPFPVVFAVFLNTALDLPYRDRFRFFSLRIASNSINFWTVSASFWPRSFATLIATSDTDKYLLRIVSASNIPDSHWCDCSFHTNSMADSFKIRTFAAPPGVHASNPRYSIGLFFFDDILFFFLSFPVFLTPVLPFAAFSFSSSSSLSSSSSSSSASTCSSPCNNIDSSSFCNSSSRWTAFDAVFLAKSTILS